MEEKKNEFNRRQFLEELIRNFINKESRSSVNQTYIGYTKLIEQSSKKYPDEAMEKKDILDKVYKLFSNQEVRKIIFEKGITAQRLISEFIPKYGETILGDNKRKYNMSDMYNDSLISLKKDSKTERNVIYREYDKEQGLTTHVYSDYEGRTITIQRVGSLIFKTFNGVEENISKYVIERTDGSKSEIYSNIDFTQMDNQSYRQAVLYELLGRNNIELSKAEGYVGEIVRLTEDEKSLPVGKTRENSLDYLYRINDEYAIEYKASDLSAVMIQRMKEENSKEMKSSDMQKEDNLGEER